MNDVTAAIGLVQLERLSSFLRRRHEIAAVYDSGIRDIPWVSVPQQQVSQSARIFYWIQTPPGARDALAQHMLENGVYTSFRYWPLHRTPLYKSDELFLGADRAAESTLMLPLHQGLTDSDIEQVLDAIHSFTPPLID